MNMLRLWLIAPCRTVFQTCGAQRDERATCRPTAAGRAPMRVFEVRNAELLESITQQAAEHGITSAAIVALIGAIDSFTDYNNPASNPAAHTSRSFLLPAEMTPAAEIFDRKPNIHVLMAVQ